MGAWNLSGFYQCKGNNRVYISKCITLCICQDRGENCVYIHVSVSALCQYKGENCK